MHLATAACCYTWSSVVSWSVSQSVWWSQSWALQKRLNWSIFHLGRWLRWAKGIVLDGGPDLPREGVFLGEEEVAAHCQVWGQTQLNAYVHRIYQWKALCLDNIQVYFFRRSTVAFMRNQRLKSNDITVLAGHCMQWRRCNSSLDVLAFRRQPMTAHPAYDWTTVWQGRLMCMWGWVYRNIT